MESAFNQYNDVIVSTCPVTGLPVYSRHQWLNVKLGGNYFMSVSIVGDRILMGKITGDSDLDSVVSATRFMTRIIREVFGWERKFVYVEDFTELKNATSDSKRYYMKFLESQKQMIALIICTVSPLIMLAIRMGSRMKLIKYNSMVEKDMPSALKRAVEILNAERPLTGPEIDRIPLLNFNKAQCPEGEKASFVAEHGRKEVETDGPLPRASMDKIKSYADELLCFLGNINWEVDGFNPDLAEKPADHPFKAVYDAVSLIKSDIDELFREREKSRNALIQGEQVARALLNATGDSSLLIRTDGTILSANETFARRFGRTPESLRNETYTRFLDPDLSAHRMAQIKKAVMTGKPVRFEDQDAICGRFYDNTIYPVYNARGRVDRLALFSRDITPGKNAEKHIQVLTQEIIKAQETERHRIARDLNEHVAQDLATLIISSDGLFEGYPDIPHEVRRRTMKFSRTLKRSIAAIRDMAYDLRPPSLDELGLVRTLARYCEEFTETSMISVDFYSAGLDKLDLDFDTEINLYRLIQEALTNVKNHSGAAFVTIRLVASFPEIILRIEDDGNGFDPESRIIEALNEKKMGLKSMEERVKLLKGEFTIRSRSGEGTMILVKMPYGQASESWENRIPARV